MLWDALTSATIADVECRTIDHKGRREISWGQLAERARRAAAALRREHGVEAETRVAAVLTNSADAVAALVGTWFAGATLVSMPIIARGMGPGEYAVQLARLCALAEAELLLIEERFRPFVPAELATSVGVATYESLVESPYLHDPSPPAEDDVAFVQFSSGTTGEPRGVMLTPAAITRQLEALADALSVDASADRGAVWVPLSHDMGLFGCLLLAWFTGIPGMLTTPERFLTSPRTWLDDCSAFGATITAAPPSALPLAARADRAATGHDALRLRLCLVGGERISGAALDAGMEVLTGRGCGEAVLTPAYGLAEATLAVTVGPVDEPPQLLRCDEQRLWAGELVTDSDGIALVSCGPPIAGGSVQINKRTKAELGEIVVRTPSGGIGYLGDPTASADIFRPDGIHTADVGVVRHGELYPIARLDDVLNVGGRRVNALAVEEAVSATGLVRAGSCVIVDVGSPDTQFVLLAELEKEVPGSRGVAEQLRQASLAVGGPPIAECMFLPRGRLPKTPSGKVQRFRARQVAASDPAPTRVRLR